MKKFVSVLLALCLLAAMLPTTALADEGTPGMEAGSSAGEAAASPEPNQEPEEPVQEPDPVSSTPGDPDPAPEDPDPEPAAESVPDPAPQPDGIPEDAGIAPVADESAGSDLDPDVTLGDTDDNGVPVSVLDLKEEFEKELKVNTSETVTICSIEKGANVTMRLKFQKSSVTTMAQKREIIKVFLAEIALGDNFNGFLTVPEGVTESDPSLNVPAETASRITDMSIPSSWALDYDSRNAVLFSCPSVKELTVKTPRFSSVSTYFPALEKLTVNVPMIMSNRFNQGGFNGTISMNSFGANKWPSLKSVTILGELSGTLSQYNVNKIAKQAFNTHPSLETVHIGPNVTVIEQDAFFQCPNLKTFVVDEANPKYRNDEKGRIIDRDTNEVVAPIEIPNYDNDPEYMPDPADPNKVPKKIAPLPTKGVVVPVIAPSNKSQFVWQDMGVLDVYWQDKIHPVVEKCDPSATGKLVVPEGIEIITGKNNRNMGTGFADCTELTEVVVADTVTEIMDNAFSGCTKLAKVTIGKNVARIGINVFAGCPENLQFEVAEGNATFTARDGKLYIGDTPVYPVPNYNSDPEYMPDPADPNKVPKKIAPAPQSGVTKSALDNGGSSFDWQDMGPLTVRWEDNYQTAVLKSCAASLKAGTAYRAPTVNISGELVIPEGIRKIDSGAFSDFDLCSRLTKVTIGKDVAYIGSNAFNFAANPNLQFDVAEGSTTFTAQDGKLYLDGRQILPVLRNSDKDDAYGLVTGEGIVPAPKAIAPAPAMGAKVPRTKEEAMDPAFACEWQDMGALKVYWVESSELQGESGKSRAAAGTLVPVVCGCAESAQGQLTIPEGIAKIDDEAFKGCDKLTKVTISQTVEAIGYDVFEGCSEELTFAVEEDNGHFAASETGSELSIDGELYAPMPNYDNDPAYMPLTVTPDGEDYSENAENLIPQKLAALPRAAAPGKSYSTGTGEEAVYRTATQNTGVLGIYQVRKDGSSLLTYCKQAAKGHIIIPGGVTEIQQNLFCREEPPVRYPGESDASFAERQHIYSLKPHMNITRVTVPDSVETIQWRFIDCSTVKRVDLGKGVKDIDHAAFANVGKDCVITVSPDNPNFYTSYNILYNKAKGTALRCFGYTGGDTLTLPDMVKTIEQSAFRTGLDGVKTVAFNEGLQKIEMMGFYNLPDVEQVYIPASVTTIELANFSQCGKLKDIYFGGTEAQWNAISLGSGEGVTTSLPNYRQVVAQNGITMHFNSKRPATPTPPADPSPTYEPDPTGEPTGSPSPTPSPSSKPTSSPTAKPTVSPTTNPTAKPVEVKPEVTVEDGKAAAALTPEQGEALVANAKKENAGAVLVKVEPPAGESCSSLEVTLPARTVEQLGTQSSASLQVETSLGRLSVPSQELAGLGRGGESVSLAISRVDDGTVNIQVKKDGAPVEEVSLKAQLPPPENLTLGNTTVAFRINPDGTETIIPKSAPDTGSNTMTVLLSGGARVKLKDNAKTCGMDTSVQGDLSGFKDVGKVSSWASAGMRWAVGAKVLGGSNGNLDPKGQATRAQVAVMATSFIKQMAKQA